MLESLSAQSTRSKKKKRITNDEKSQTIKKTIWGKKKRENKYDIR